MITQDPQTKYDEWHQQTKVDRIKELIGVTKLEKNYGQFQDRRDLCKRYQLFLVDSKLIQKVPKLTGKAFYDKKKFENCLFGVGK